MTTYVMRGGRLVERDRAPPREVKNGSAAYVISDAMEPTRHMADGNYYSSKAKFRAATRAAGCVEVGNDPAILRPKRPAVLDRGARREAIRKAIYDIRNGRVPGR